ncbi:MAG: hypothetical protein IPK82_14280 [Polyangiaceae bacterium]|nr:hypothetical protein [Polyangiaceae bacterium]
MCTFWSSSANAGDFEIGPWLGWAAGPNLGKGGPSEVTFVNAGFDVTTPVWIFGGGYGGSSELRFGPWIAYQSLLGVGSMGEGGLTLVLTKTEHAQWGTFGVRMGGGYGLDNQAHFVATFWGGVRYVPVRAGESPDGIANKVTGIRIVASVHHQLDPENISALVFGVEFEPEYLLPPYSPYKWAGKH